MESEIQRFYDGQSVLITGASGFLGKILLEKLLRSCPGLLKVYVVIRSKDGKTPKERLNDMLDIPLFVPLKQENPKFKNKIEVLEGDAEVDNYGLSKEAIQTINKNVNIIINNASVIKYNETFKKVITVNVQGVQSLLSIAKKIKHLKSFLHISTVYSNFPRPEIEEIIYDHSSDYNKMMTLARTTPDGVLEVMLPRLIEGWPNACVFSKALAESLIKEECQNLPIGIVRPSIVMSTFKEPIQGWNEIIAGPSKMSLAYLTGVYHVPLVKSTAAADLMPADYVANAIIAATWATHNKSKFKSQNIEVYQSTIDETIFEETRMTSDIPIFNVVSSTLNVINWGEFWQNLRVLSEAIPVQNHVWFQYLWLTKCKPFYMILMYLFHYFPAYIMDFAQKMVGRNGRYVELVSKMDEMSQLMAPFTTKEFAILSNNTINLWTNLNAKDKQLFYFDVIRLNWFDFLKTHVMGCRQYLVKEDLTNLEEAIHKNRMMRVINTLVSIFLLYLFVKSLMCIYNYVL